MVGRQWAAVGIERPVSECLEHLVQRARLAQPGNGAAIEWPVAKGRQVADKITRNEGLARGNYSDQPRVLFEG